jgi:hypothetical protein
MSFIRAVGVGLFGMACTVACAMPANATPDDAVLSGTYDVVATYGTATANDLTRGFAETYRA